MGMREKLIVLIQSAVGGCSTYWASLIADKLIANGVTIQKWIPVTERLPDIELVEVRAEDMDLFPCLVVKTAPQTPKKRFVTKAWYDGEGFMDVDCIWVTKSVTHWMPLPEPPSGERRTDDNI